MWYSSTSCNATNFSSFSSVCTKMIPCNKRQTDLVSQHSFELYFTLHWQFFDQGTDCVCFFLLKHTHSSGHEMRYIDVHMKVLWWNKVKRHVVSCQNRTRKYLITWYMVLRIAHSLTCLHTKKHPSLLSFKPLLFPFDKLKCLLWKGSHKITHKIKCDVKCRVFIYKQVVQK